MSYVLKKSFVREFPLVQVQIWGRRYDKIFLGEPVPDIPIYIFILKNGLTNAYRNVSGHAKAINKIIKEKLIQNPQFLDHLLEERSEIFKQSAILNKKKSISLSEFKIFLDNVFSLWEVHYIAQFLPLDKIEFDEEIRRKAINWRSTIDLDIQTYWNAIKPRLIELFPKLEKLAYYISWGEIKSSQIPDQKELAKRAKDEIYLYGGKIITENELEKIKRKYSLSLEDDDIKMSDLKELNGEIACAGRATGHVKIILKEDEVPLVGENDILVSYMTMPTFLPAMKRAAAFITDEGGITCHAAIVARELKKPCIIGTKIATKVLKDGDLVEVNANKGIIKILKEKA